MFWALTSVTLSLTHTLRQPLNNSIHFSSSLEFWVTTVVKWRWKGNKNMKCSDFQYIFSLSLGKNYTIMSFSWCAHQWNWKPHLSSFGLIEKSEFREFSWAVSILCCQVEQLKEVEQDWRELLGPDAIADCRNPRKDLCHGIPIQFARAVYQVAMQTGCKYAT